MPKAIQMTEYGPPSVLNLVEVDLPPLLDNEVRFRVLVAPVNRADLEIRAGNWPIQHDNPFPYTPGIEAIGEVVAIGEAVETIKVGDTVITMMQQLGGTYGLRPGGYQEFVTVEADNVAKIPPINEVHVAALGLAGVTAYNGLKWLDIHLGDIVVIQGASGEVGSVAVTLAKTLGATVVATTLCHNHDDYLQNIGADEIIYLGEEILVERLGPGSVEGVLELIGERTFADSVAVLKPGGSLCLVDVMSGETLTLSARNLMQSVHLTGYSAEHLTGADLRADMEQLCHWLTIGDIPPPPYQTFPLTEAAHVHHLIESNQLIGRALLIP